MATRRFLRSGSPWRHYLADLTSRRVLVGGLTAVGVLLVLSTVTVLWWSRDLPDPQNIDSRRVSESTKIFDRAGTHLLYEIGDIHRTRIVLNDISPLLRQATLAAEDDKFYEHHGIALTGIVRGLILKPLSGSRVQGGSTITQQLIKNSILTPERTLQRKVKEAVLAIELEQRFTKDQIFEMYLNDIPYGSQAYGVEAAAQAFFGTSAKNITLVQAATLAALPQAPSYYSPYGSHIEDLKARQHYILSRMVSLNMIKPEEAAAAKKEPLTFLPRREAIGAPHFVFYVKELLDQQFGERVVEQGGLKVLTTLDVRLQKSAEEALKTRQVALQKQGISNAALVALDPKTGDILAMVGSIDYFNTAIDGNVNVTIRHRSPGSSIKPFVYAAAWQKGFTPDTMLVDAVTDFGQGYIPKDFDLKERGPVTMRQALANSLNIPAVKTLYLAGVKNVTDLAQRMGMTSINDPERYGLSLVLGGGEVRLLDEVSAYGAFATEGVHHPQRAILKVADRAKTLFDSAENQTPGDNVLDPQIAREVSSVLSDNNARALVFGTRSYLQLGPRPVAAKTGTTQEFRDGWTVGYTPSLVAGVWVGNNDNTPMKAREPGALTAAPIWNEFMRQALTGTPIESFTPPAPLTNVPPGVLTGQLPEIKGKWDPDTNTLYSLDCPLDIGQPRTIKELRTLLFYVQRSNPLGSGPANAESDPQYSRWDAGIAAWRDKYNTEHRDSPADPLYVDSLPTPVCDSQNAQDLPKVRLVEPATTIIHGNVVTARVEIDSPRPIKEVRFSVDGQDIGRPTSEPYQAAFSVPDNFKGRKTLLVQAVTDNNLIGRAHRTFIFNPDDSQPAVTLLSPRNGTAFTPTSFPQTIKVSAADPSGIDAVDVLSRKDGASSTQRIGRTTIVSPVAANRYEVSWHDSPGSGSYEIYAIAYDKTGNFSETPHVTVTIE